MIQLIDHTLDCAYGSNRHSVMDWKSKIAIHVFSLHWIIGTATMYLDHPKKWTPVYFCLKFMEPSKNLIQRVI